MSKNVWTDQELLRLPNREELPLGGKTKGLLALMENSVRVPAFFVLLPDATLKSAEEAYKGSKMGRVAVRSSALLEDGKDHSFAGMYESVLGVDNKTQLRAAIKHCRASNQSDRILGYRKMYGIEDSALTVVVQEMVEGDSSGVLFSHDPMEPEKTLISAGLGLGEGVVQGLVSCDTIRVTRLGAVERDIVRKETGVFLKDGEPVETEIDKRYQMQPALSSEQSIRLAKQSQTLAENFGYPLDIEWTLLNNKIYFLQARPITQKIPQGRRLLWDNSNIIESYCGLTLPLTYSFASNAYSIVYQLFCQVMGVSSDRIQKYSTIFPRMIGLIRGHIFYNLNAWYTIVSLLPGYQWNREFMEGMMGLTEVSGEADAAKIEGSWLKTRWLVSKMMVLLIWRAFRLDRDVVWFHKVVQDALDEHSVEEIKQRSSLELLDTYGDLERRLLWSWHVPIVSDFFVMIAHGLLKKQAETHFPEERDIHNALLSGEGGMISAAPAHAVEEIIAVVRPDAALSKSFQEFSMGELNQKELETAIAQNSSAEEVVTGYIERFGDRCADELKLETETLRHNPIPLYQNLASMLRRKVGTERESFLDNPLRKSAENVVTTNLSGWRLWLFQKILKWARKRVQGRENLRFERTRVFARVREVFRAMAVQFVAENIINEEKDIFYLEVQEIFGWVQGTTTTVNLKGLIELRRAEYAVWEKEGKPADRFYTYGSIWLHNQFIGKGLPPKDGEIRGTPACPGTVRGHVRCIVDPTTETLEPGEIMVCYRTDPGWAPLFPNASAILVERGSLLSHSAVVARELGIPTIVAIPNLMERLKTGQEITVFANDGRVEIHKEEGE